jgi:hypothetical protein
LTACGILHRAGQFDRELNRASIEKMFYIENEQDLTVRKEIHKEKYPKVLEIVSESKEKVRFSRLSKTNGFRANSIVDRGILI